MASRWLVQTASSRGQAASGDPTASAMGGILSGGSTDISHVVKSATYDATNKKLILEKDGGDTVDVPISTLGVHESTLANQASSINTLTTAGYQTASDVSTYVTAQNYQDHNQVDSIVTAKGYQTANDVSTYVTAQNYQTASDVSTFVNSQNYVTNTVNNLTNYYDKNHSNNNFLDGITLSGKTLTIARQAGSFQIALPIDDSVDPSPFAAMRWVDSNENTLTRGTIAAQIKSTTNVSGDDGFGSSITLDGGLQVSGNEQYITEDFIMDTEDGYGVLEIQFGDVANLSGTLFKIETVDYRKLTDSFDANWGDTEFKINNGQLYLHSNGGSNNVIRCTDSGYPSAGIYFIHAGGATGQNPSGFSTNLGRYSNKSDYNKAVEAAGAVQSWNNANANNVGSSGPINDHYFARGDSLLGLFRNSRELEEFNVGGMSHFALWRGGPEFLNASPSTSGGWSISSNDHFMIHVDRQFVKVYKNGNLTNPVRNIPNSGNNRVGGVTTLRKRLIIGNTGNSSNLSFTVKKFKWHGNKKDNDQLRSIYDDRSFNPSGGSSVSNVDLTPYFNGLSYNNSSTPPQLTLQAASGNTTVNLRDCYTKAEVTALINAASPLIAKAKFHKGISTNGPDGSGVNTMSEDLGFSSVTSSGGNKVTTSLGSGGATYVTVQHNIVFTFGSGNTATPLSIYDYYVSVTPTYTSAQILYYGVQQQGYASFKVTVRVLWSGNYHNDPFGFYVAVFAP